MRHFTILVRLAPITVGLASASVIAAKANDHSSDVVPPHTVSERTEAKTGDTGSVTKPVAFAKRATVHEMGQGEGHAHVGRSNAAVTVLSEIDAGHIRDLPSRRPVTIHLPGNPSTGYAWNVLRAQNVTVKQPIETVPEPKTPAGVVGAPEITVIHVLPGHPGAASLELGYVGPGKTRPDKVLHYRFTVK